MPLPPGTILQRIHFKRRLKGAMKEGRFFYDIGAGRGDFSQILLDAGWNGAAFDLSAEACSENRCRHRAAIDLHRYEVRAEDFLLAPINRKADLIVSSMVIEHLPENKVIDFLDRAGQVLNPRGRLCLLVPGSPKHWGIEDEIAGHYRRYLIKDFEDLAQRRGWLVRDLRGLTYPLSNLLLPLSNWLVKRAESNKLKLDKTEQTLKSGVRQVFLKTTFPSFAGFLINEITLYPFHLLQLCAAHNPNSLVIYCELDRPDKTPLYPS